MISSTMTNNDGAVVSGSENNDVYVWDLVEVEIWRASVATLTCARKRTGERDSYAEGAH